MEIQSIHHAQLPFAASERAAIRAFYNGLLGLLERTHPESSTQRFDAGQQRLDLVPSSHGAVVPEPAHLAFEVRDLPNLRQRLLDAGYALDESRALPGHHRFYVRDPAGNPLEFLEPLPDPFENDHDANHA